MIFGVAYLLAYENWQSTHFLRFSPLMREILHAWRFFIGTGDFTRLAGERER